MLELESSHTLGEVESSRDRHVRIGEASNFSLRPSFLCLRVSKHNLENPRTTPTESVSTAAIKQQQQ